MTDKEKIIAFLEGMSKGCCPNETKEIIINKIIPWINSLPEKPVSEDIDYKEKYEQALERARQFSEKPYLEDSAGIVEYIFPELKENGDEKIKQELIEYHKAQAFLDGKPNNKHVKFVDWLEKQGGLTKEAMYDKPAEWNEEDENMLQSVLWHVSNSVSNGKSQDTRCDLTEWLKSLKDRVLPQPKQEWSSSDERNLQGIIDEIEANKNQAPNYDIETYDRFLNWLKSLKDRVLPQPKQEWSSSDERNLQGIIDEIEANKNQAPNYDIETYDRFLNWLKSLKERVQPQPKQEWSEEDENHVKSILSTIECCKAQFPNAQAVVEAYNADIDWLKSLRHQNRWKPSDEQLCALEHATMYNTLNANDAANLAMLYNDLKKLK